ncbi:MAG: (Fe-S)-binding protein, partial [Candidatus Binataceae bacterium]
PPPPPASDGPSVFVHPGCVAQVIAGSANRNSEAALRAAGYRIAPAAQAACCGALDLHSGNRDRAIRFARANVRALSASGATAIVSTGSGCSVAMAEYGDLLKDDCELAAAARDVSSRVTDLSSLILKTPLSVGGDPNRTISVAYHDACHLAHGLGVREPPRKLLQSIPGVRLIELAESDFCCGSAGSYNLTEPEMARALVARKVDNIIATGADYVVMANVGCQFQIAAELRRRNAKTQAIHLADFLALATQRQRDA